MSVFGMERHKMRNEAGAAEYELWLIEHSRCKAEKINESKQDQSTDANCDQANNASENSVLTDVDDTNVPDSQANSDANEFQYPIYKVSKATGLVVKFTGLTFGEVVEATERSQSKGFTCDFLAHVDNRWWQDWTPPVEEVVESPKIDPVIVENVEAFNRMDDVAEKREIPLPQYKPDDVAFKKSDTVFWYTVDGIKEVFETSSDAIHAAQELVKNRKIVATIHAVASKPHAIIKPVVTTELEYV